MLTVRLKTHINLPSRRREHSHTAPTGHETARCTCGRRTPPIAPSPSARSHPLALPEDPAVPPAPRCHCHRRRHGRLDRRRRLHRRLRRRLGAACTHTAMARQPRAAHASAAERRRHATRCSGGVGGVEGRLAARQTARAQCTGSRQCCERRLGKATREVVRSTNLPSLGRERGLGKVIGQGLSQLRLLRTVALRLLTERSTSCSSVAAAAAPR